MLCQIRRNTPLPAGVVVCYGRNIRPSLPYPVPAGGLKQEPGYVARKTGQEFFLCQGRMQVSEQQMTFSLVIHF